MRNHRYRSRGLELIGGLQAIIVEALFVLCKETSLTFTKICRKNRLLMPNRITSCLVKVREFSWIAAVTAAMFSTERLIGSRPSLLLFRVKPVPSK